MLRGAASAGLGASALALVGCGDDDDEAAPAAAQVAQQAEQQAQQAEQQAQPAAAQQQAQQQQQQAAVAQAGDDSPPIGGQLRISDSSDLASFDGFLTFGYKAFLHNHNCYPMLTQFSNEPGQSSIDFQPELWLAESYEQPDDTTYLFTIKNNAVWEDRSPVDGRNVTGEDVAFSYAGERYAGYPNRGAIQPSLAGVEATDDRTVRFDLSGPLAPFLLYLGHHAGPYVMPTELLVDEMSRQTMISAGPYLTRRIRPGLARRLQAQPELFRRSQAVFGFAGDQLPQR